ncbi:glutamine--tRNA ligase/YqeY domain fusion protein [Aggregicoccus sp. 17bor-14]|uniref:glutamine--tRNA ligase/YqeY domain fusion protein n=1 Tax=Myxococcaceae TaxID=31 RepID=UPI00129C3A61|nr:MULTISPECIES: glutamine--tRNA ligase/YqeY domain fusion protein [Myxococcaceae]MBF5043474.1 glutamine--tRNA ligase/YqeY domain fusion protein [Simulacricoccus sp. 17bor-14]MRI89232.1 glutamine--tRNA ligase/YqeY domain fusion protein [Aggregicoccus sp. 17bor-14]
MSKLPAVPPPAPEARRVSPNFITEVIDADLQAGRHTRVVTRFPPEPNGYAHLGHAFASYLDFMTAQDYGGVCHLRMDDTNPEGETQEYAESIIRDMQWLGWDTRHLFYASDYYEELYGYAEQLIEKGLAYVESVSGEEMARLRGTVDVPGTPSPYRSRTVEENLTLFRRMRAGEFPNGAHALRAKIDLGSSNFKLRDPVLYRILHASHYRTGSHWCIYPMYDFAHPISDAIEGITHSMCSLEFVDNRAIYDWLMEHLFPASRTGRTPPRQYEFGRRSLEYTVVSKRKLRRLVAEGVVKGWDDPRMPTLSGLRRRGATPEAARAFAAQIGVSRTNRTVDLVVLENAIREDLNLRAPRAMAVTQPLKVTVTNLEGERTLQLPYWPQEVEGAEGAGGLPLPGGERVPAHAAVREVPFTRELYIEREDFSSSPPKGFKRLTPGGTVRLRGAGLVRCDEVVAGADGEPTELRVSLLGEDAKAAGVIHWVSATRGVPAEFRLFDRLFTVPNPDGEQVVDVEQPGHDYQPQGAEVDFMRFVNPHSLVVTRGVVEPSVRKDPAHARYQFERVGYFWQDPVDSRPDALVFNRIITLRDTWVRKEEASGAEARAPAKAPRAERRPEAPAAPQPPRAQLTPEQEPAFARLRERGVSENDASLLAREPALRAFLEAAPEPQRASLAPWVVNDLAVALREGSNRVEVAALVELVKLVQEGAINARTAKDVLAEAQGSGEAPARIVERKGLRVVSDEGALRTAIQAVLEQNPQKVAEYRGGKKGLAGFFTGQIMRATGGQADPQAVARLLAEMLG